MKYEEVWKEKYENLYKNWQPYDIINNEETVS
jgi:hypothetical protein